MQDFTVKVNNGIISVVSPQVEVANFDMEGRLLYFTTKGTMYKRRLDNDLFRIGWRGDLRVVEKVPANEARIFIDRSAEMMDAVKKNESSSNNSIMEIPTRNFEDLERDREVFADIYGNISPVIPPDQINSIYVGLTSGCKWNRTSLCRSYSGREYTTFNMEQFRDHVNRIRDFLGKGLSARRSVFLGDPNSLNADQKILEDALDYLVDTFHLPVYSFLDIFTTPKTKRMAHFQLMSKHGLNRVFIAIETGDYRLIKYLNEHTNISETINLFNNLKFSRIPVSLVVMLGTGGKKFQQEHISGTASIISQMDLGPGDMVYLSPIGTDDPSYNEIAAKHFDPITPEEINSQIKPMSEAIKAAYLDMNGKEFPVPISFFDLAESVY
ncbi:MAG: hypothetical protein M1431_05635 [Candidatus Thermoplasmatota archaeon]|nr:hypothetical protein [Candidatus Thermoplasmatota archaeon]